MCRIHAQYAQDTCYRKYIAKDISCHCFIFLRTLHLFCDRHHQNTSCFPPPYTLHTDPLKKEHLPWNSRSSHSAHTSSFSKPKPHSNIEPVFPRSRQACKTRRLTSLCIATQYTQASRARRGALTRRRVQNSFFKKNAPSSQLGFFHVDDFYEQVNTHVHT